MWAPMPAAALPADEHERLQALRELRVLDTPPEERFDRVTRIAARLLDVPIAAVSLVDENRQWLKSSIGFNTREQPRSASFCAHALLEDETLVIEDARSDPRVADNPYVVAEPFVRFYAGRLLRAPSGHKLGTLCVIDRRPRLVGSGDLA